MEKFCSTCGGNIENGECTCDVKTDSKNQESAIGMGKVDFDKAKKKGFIF